MVSYKATLAIEKNFMVIMIGFWSSCRVFLLVQYHVLVRLAIFSSWREDGMHDFIIGLQASKSKSPILDMLLFSVVKTYVSWHHWNASCLELPS